MMELSTGRSVLLTGVGKPGQLGEALLKAFTGQGDTVYATGRSLADVEMLAEQARARGGDAYAFAADLADEASVAALIADVSGRTQGTVDVLVHAAGKFLPFGPVANGDLDVWLRTFASNTTSAFLITRESLPLLRAAHGTIVYIASLMGLTQVSPSGMADYSAAKAALLQLMRAVADEEKGVVRANALAPGGIKTAVMRSAFGEAPGFVTPEEVAAKALYLAGPGSGDTTGDVVPM